MLGTADWMDYSRWVCRKTEAGGWCVVAGLDSRLAPAPNTFGPGMGEYAKALRRSDELNSAEVMTAIEKQGQQKKKSLLSLTSSILLIFG